MQLAYYHCLYKMEGILDISLFLFFFSLFNFFLFIVFFFIEWYQIAIPLAYQGYFISAILLSIFMFIFLISVLILCFLGIFESSFGII